MATGDLDEQNKGAYTVAEAARILVCSPRTILRWFGNERGVIRLNPKGKRHSIRIPKHVFERVIRRWTVQ
jgi:hypothetical protein